MAKQKEMKMEIKNVEVSLSKKEIEAFHRLCLEQNTYPARKIGELIHGFLLAEGVKHQIKKIA